MKTINILFQMIVTVIFLFILKSDIFSQPIFFTDDSYVPIFQGIIVDNSSKDIYWDLGEIYNNRLYLAAGVKQRGVDVTGNYDYDNANWYKNDNDSNFNEENPDYRFIYAEYPNAINAITGLKFVKLNYTNSKRDVIISREDGILYIYRNQNSSIELDFYQRIFNAHGKVASTGKFSNDNLEDIAVISESSLKIYKGADYSLLDTNAVLTLYNVNATKAVLSQVSNWIEPYATFKQTSNDKDEIIVRTGTSIKIYKNNNSNGISDSTVISISDQDSDFKIADINNDGWNDLIVASLADGIKIFLNNTGTISSTASYTNENYDVQNLDIADFDKDGWNDIVAAGFYTVYLFLNSHGSFSQSVSYTKDSHLTELHGRKLAAADLHNQGGLSVLFSGTIAISDSSESPDYPWTSEVMLRFNAFTKNADPAPAIIFCEAFYTGFHNRPKIYFYNKGERDFLRYRIYKKSPYVNNSWTLIDSTSNDYYIDYNEIVVGGSPSTNNTFYCAKVVDNSYKVSINSDTVGLETICPSCSSGERLIVNADLPNEYSLKQNYPNPFNPSTNIQYDLPEDNFVFIKIYDLLGREIITLLNEPKQAGSYIITFDASNLSSGVYYYKFKAGNFEQVRRMILLK
ncbi:MAG: hypothetical protein HGGPFJEG_02988 [Ignavibacteria bacterium]|nr:hypothetical protein [Ignavibacteria bacterium]